MELTVGELKEMLNIFPDDFIVQFQDVRAIDGKVFPLDFYRLKDRGGICYVEWNPNFDNGQI